MNTFSTHAENAVTAVATATGVDVALRDDVLTVDGQPVPLPAQHGRTKLTGSYGDLLGVKGLLPTVPQGDDRDRLLWRIVGEARTDHDEAASTSLPLDVGLGNGLPQKLPFPSSDANDAVADAIMDRFFSAKKTKNLKPIHSSLPMNYAHGLVTNKPARYRMFSAEILVFLLYDETTGTTDRDLVERLLSFFSTEEDLTAIDRLFLDIAKREAPFPDATPDASALINRYERGTREDLNAAGGVFCAPSLAMFRRDLKTVLDTPLPKPDKVQWLTLLLSLHIATRLYRLAVVKGNELDLAIAASVGAQAPAEAKLCPCRLPGTGPSSAVALAKLPTGCLSQCPLAGAVKFRTGTGRYRPVSRRDPCRDSYIELDQRKLLALPAVLVTTNLALRAWTALGGPPYEAAKTAALAEALDADPGLRGRHNAVCAAIAALVHANKLTSADTPHLKDTAGLHQDRVAITGLVALRDSVLRHRRTDLRHQSRDVVNQLMLDINAAAGGSLVSRNGTHTFYEADERLLVMLVRLVCPEPVPYDNFLTGLADYGLAPQDSNERAALADSLERLGLLVRYSDAGEASFVHYR